MMTSEKMRKFMTERAAVFVKYVLSRGAEDTSVLSPDLAYITPILRYCRIAWHQIAACRRDLPGPCRESLLAASLIEIRPNIPLNALQIGMLHTKWCTIRIKGIVSVHV